MEPRVESSKPQEFLARLRERATSASAAPSSRVEIARYLATSWPLAIAAQAYKETHRYSLHLPEGARTLGLLPAAGETAVLFICGALLEIWPGDLWVKNARGVARGADELLRQADAELDDDEYGSEPSSP